MAASSSLDSHIKLWDLDAGKQIRTLDAGPGKLNFTPYAVFCVWAEVSVASLTNLELPPLE